MEDADLTVREVAAQLKIHPETVRVWLRAGIFPNAYQLPRRSGWRIPREDVDAVTKKPWPDRTRRTAVRHLPGESPPGGIAL